MRYLLAIAALIVGPGAVWLMVTVGRDTTSAGNLPPVGAAERPEPTKLPNSPPDVLLKKENLVNRTIEIAKSYGGRELELVYVRPATVEETASLLFGGGPKSVEEARNIGPLDKRVWVVRLKGSFPHRSGPDEDLPPGQEPRRYAGYADAVYDTETGDMLSSGYVVRTEGPPLYP